jgi:hypothetical protein
MSDLTEKFKGLTMKKNRDQENVAGVRKSSWT